jgi:hypothetical protein
MDPNGTYQQISDNPGVNPQNVLQAENYIRQNKESYSLDQIKEALKNSGYLEADINLAIANVFPQGVGQENLAGGGEGFNYSSNQGAAQVLPVPSTAFGDLFFLSVQFFKLHLSKLMLIGLIGVAFMMPSIIKDTFFPSYYGAGFNTAFNLDYTSIVFGLMGFIGSVFSGLVAMNYIIKAHKGFSMKVVEAYKESVSLFLPYLLLTITVGLMIIAAFFAFIIPSIIVAVYLSFAMFALIDEGLTVNNAIYRSYNLVKGNWFEVFVKYLLVFLLMIVAIILFAAFSLLFGLFWAVLNQIFAYFVGIFSSIFIYELYRAIKQKKDGGA